MAIIENTIYYTVKEAEEKIKYHKAEIKRWRKLISDYKKRKNKKECWK